MRWIWTAAVVLIALAGGATFARGTTSHGLSANVLRVEGSIIDVVGDGPWVAVHSMNQKGKYTYCHAVAFWNTVSGKLVPVQGLGDSACAAELDFAQDMAFAGGRVVWTNTEEQRYPICTVYTATVTAPRARVILQCPSDDLTGYGGGQDVGAWAGDGPLLVGNSIWGDSGCDNCGSGPPALVSVRPGGLPQLRTGDQYLYVRSVDAGRIVLLRDDGDVAVLDRTGRIVRVLPFAPKAVLQVVLEGDDLVVKKAQGLEVYDPGTGKLRKTWNVRPGSTLTDVHAGIAVLLRDKQVQLLRLRDGHGDAYTTPGAVVDAALEPEGLTYAYNLKKGARVLFVPFERVNRRLR